MPTRAFVLCSDEKALDAVSQILGELGIAFEQFHDVDFASKRLAVQEFDLVVVDCDNPDDATHLIDCMRSSDLNRSAMTLAVVNGKAGVPVAFRLGAELVITKPVSLEQARSTLRTAIAMRKKAHPETKTQLPPVNQPKVAAGSPKTTLPFPQPAPKLESSQPEPSELGAPIPVLGKKSTTGIPAQAKLELSLSTPLSNKTVDLSSARAESEKESAPALDIETPDASLPAQAFSQKSAKREVSRSLVAGLVFAVIGGAGYAAYTMVPAFHSMTIGNYELMRSRLLGAKPAATAASRPPVPLRPEVKPAPAPAAPRDGFVDASMASSLSNAATPKNAKPVILATTATNTIVEDPEPITVAAELADQHVSTRVDPIYPETLRRKAVYGDVVLQTVVAKDGSVSSVSVVSGNPQLAAAAEEAVKQWKYETFVHDGVAVSFQTHVTVEFAAPQKPSR